MLLYFQFLPEIIVEIDSTVADNHLENSAQITLNKLFTNLRNKSKLDF